MAVMAVRVELELVMVEIIVVEEVEVLGVDGVAGPEHRARPVRQ